MLFASTLKYPKIQINKLLVMCAKMNLKLSPSKFRISNAVKFGGTIISSEKIQNGHVIFMDPLDQRIVPVTEMSSPKTKKDLRVLCGMV